MEEERTNNETLNEQEDDCYIFDDGTKVPWNRMNAIWEAKHDILVDDIYFEYESPDYYRYDIVNAAHPDCISMLIGASNESFDTNVAIATMYMARGVWGNWEFSTPSDKEMADLWDDAERRLKNGQPIPMKYDPSGGPLDLCCNIIEIYPTRSDRTSQEIAEGEFTDELLEEAQQNVFAVNPEEFDSSALCAVENISHIFDSSSPNEVSAYTIKCFAEMKDSEVLNERAANYIADHIDECDLSVDEVRNAMAVWMCKRYTKEQNYDYHFTQDEYPEETFDPGRLSEKGDESLTKFIEKCDRQKLSSVTQMVNNCEFAQKAMNDACDYLTDNYGRSYWGADYETWGKKVWSDAEGEFVPWSLSESAEESYKTGATVFIKLSGAGIKSVPDEIFQEKEFSEGIERARMADEEKQSAVISADRTEEPELESMSGIKR